MCLVFLSLLCPRYDSNELSQSFKSLLFKTHSTIWLDLLVCSKSHLSWWMLSLFARSHAWSLTQNGRWTHYVPGFSISAPNSDILCLNLTSYHPILVCSFCLFEWYFCSICNHIQNEVAQKRPRNVVVIFFSVQIFPTTVECAALIWYYMYCPHMFFLISESHTLYMAHGSKTAVELGDVPGLSLFLRPPATLSVKSRATQN